MRPWTIILLLGTTPGCFGDDRKFSDGDADTDTDSDTDTDTDSDTDSSPPCDLLTADPCAETENCILGFGGSTACFEAGDGEQGDACGSSGDCARLYHCMPPANACSHWCTASGSECPEGSSCTLVVLEDPADTGSDEVGRVCKITIDCNVFDQVGCDAGQNCWVVNPGGPVFDCGAPGAGGQGEACRFLSDCLTGFQCDADVCKAYCNAEAGEPSCTDPQTCVGQGFQNPDGIQVGYCE